MISEKEYLNALETIKQYKKQLRIGGVVRSAVKNTKTVWLDDTWYVIEVDGTDVKAENRYEFSDIVDILLTPSQREKFIGDDRNRDFQVTQKRIDKMFTYINSDDNIWRNVEP